MIDFGELDSEVGSDWAMDRIHTHWILAVLRAIRPPSVVEIGCHRGVSTTALVQALRENCVKELQLIDVNIQPTVRKMSMAGITMHEARSEDVLPTIKSRDSLFVVDGDHSLQCVREELPLVLATSPLAIVAHDITAEASGYHQCDGARWLWEQLQSLGWHCVVDCRRRENAKTHRGLLIATPIQGYAKSIVTAWRETCGT